MTQIHPTAVVDRRSTHRRLRVRGALRRHRPPRDASARARGRPALRDRGPHDDRARQPHLPVRVARRDPAGQEIRRRAERTGHRRPQHHPRVLHVQHRLARRRRRDARRQRQLDHGLYAHRARLPGRRPHHAREQHHARRARRAGRLGHGGRADGDSPVREGGRAGHGGLCQRGVAGCPALHAGGRQSARGARLQHGRPAPAGIQRGTHRSDQADAQAALPRGPYARAGARGHRGARRRRCPKRRRTSP